MTQTCPLCRKDTFSRNCYVRVGDQERPACRPCWEQLLLDPRRILRGLQGQPLESLLAGQPS